MYETVQKLEYLDMVIQETLRLYPPGYHTNRECMKTTVVGGITVPKGTIVEIPIYHIHRSPQYWDDPEKFDPGRYVSWATGFTLRLIVSLHASDSPTPDSHCLYSCNRYSLYNRD